MDIKTNKKTVFIFSLLIACLVFAAYSRAIGVGFIRDDKDFFEYSKLPMEESLVNTYAGRVRPISILHARLVSSLFKNKIAVWHIFSISLHVFNALLVFLIGAYCTRNIKIAFLCSLFFGIKAAAAEPVIWLNSAGFLLCGLFVLFALIEWHKFIISGKRINYLWSFLLTVVAVFSNESAIVLPVIFTFQSILFDRMKRKLALSLSPFYVFSFIFGFFLIYLMHLNGTDYVNIENARTVFTRILSGFKGLSNIFIPIDKYLLYGLARNACGASGYHLLKGVLSISSAFLALWVAGFAFVKLNSFGKVFLFQTISFSLTTSMLGLEVMRRAQYVPSIFGSLLLGILMGKFVDLGLARKYKLAANIILISFIGSLFLNFLQIVLLYKLTSA